MISEIAMRRALDAMVRANRGKPVTAVNGVDHGWEHSVVLEAAAARVALRALVDATL